MHTYGRRRHASTRTAPCNIRFCGSTPITASTIGHSTDGEEGKAPRDLLSETDGGSLSLCLESHIDIAEYTTDSLRCSCRLARAGHIRADLLPSGLSCHSHNSLCIT